MALILNIETSTTVCSVSVAESGKSLAHRELDSGYTHAENLHVFIKEVLKEAGIAAARLDAVAVGRGPGSYTGLRIGVSAAKGLAYALSIPLISVPTLMQMASEAVKQQGADRYYCPMLDARRMEVYCEVFDHDLKTISPVAAVVISEDSLSRFRLGKPVCFFGDGMPKAKGLLSALPGSSFSEGITPSALAMAGLSYRSFLSSSFEDTAYFEPFYLKAFMAQGQ